MDANKKYDEDIAVTNNQGEDAKIDEGNHDADIDHVASVESPKTPDRELESAVKSVTEDCEMLTCSPDTTTISQNNMRVRDIDNDQAAAPMQQQLNSNVALNSFQGLQQHHAISAQQAPFAPSLATPMAQMWNAPSSVALDPLFKTPALHGEVGKRRPPIRKRYPTFIVNELEQHFEKDNYPTRNGYIAIAEMMGLDLSRVKVWFQNRRSRDRRQRKRQREKENQTSEESESKRAKIETLQSKVEQQVIGTKDGSDVHVQPRPLSAIQRNIPIAPVTTPESRRLPPSVSIAATDPLQCKVGYMSSKELEAQRQALAFQNQLSMLTKPRPSNVAQYETFQKQFENFQPYRPQPKSSAILTSPTQSPVTSSSAFPMTSVSSAAFPRPIRPIRRLDPTVPYYLPFTQNRPFTKDTKPSIDNLRFPYQTFPSITPPQWHRMRLASPQELGFENIVSTLASTRPYLLPYLNDPYMQLILQNSKDQSVLTRASANEGMSENQNNQQGKTTVDNLGSAGNENHGSTGYPMIPQSLFGQSMNTPMPTPNVPFSQMAYNAYGSTSQRAPYSNFVFGSGQDYQQNSELDKIERMAGNMLRELILSNQKSITTEPQQNDVGSVTDARYTNTFSSAFSRPCVSTTPKPATQTLSDLYAKPIDPNNNEQGDGSGYSGQALIDNSMVRPTQQQGSFYGEEMKFAEPQTLYPPKARSCPPSYVQSVTQAQSQHPWLGPYQRQCIDLTMYDSGYTSLMGAHGSSMLSGRSNSATPFAASQSYASKNEHYQQESIVFGSTNFQGGECPNYSISPAESQNITAAASSVPANSNTTPSFTTTSTFATPNYSLQQFTVPSCTTALKTEETFSEENDDEEEETENEESSAIEQITIDSSSTLSNSTSHMSLRNQNAWSLAQSQAEIVSVLPLPSNFKGLSPERHNPYQALDYKHISARISPILSTTQMVGSPPSNDDLNSMGPLLTSTPEHESASLQEADGTAASGTNTRAYSEAHEYERISDVPSPLRVIEQYSPKYIGNQYADEHGKYAVGQTPQWQTGWETENIQEGWHQNQELYEDKWGNSRAVKSEWPQSKGLYGENEDRYQCQDGFTRNLYDPSIPADEEIATFDGWGNSQGQPSEGVWGTQQQTRANWKQPDQEISVISKQGWYPQDSDIAARYPESKEMQQEVGVTWSGELTGLGPFTHRESSEQKQPSAGGYFEPFSRADQALANQDSKQLFENDTVLEVQTGQTKEQDCQPIQGLNLIENKEHCDKREDENDSDGKEETTESENEV